MHLTALNYYIFAGMPATPVQPAPPRHLPYLDAARGIAAMMVLIGHFIGWKYSHLLLIKCLCFIFNSADAVSFFFVLSGMVLSYQYIVLGNSLDLRKYYINRFMRLFPAFFLAVLIHALYWQRQNTNISQIYDGMLTNGFWEEVFLPKSRTKVFGPGWTLVIELSASFFIPFFIAIGKVNRKLLWWLVLAYFCVNRFTDQFALHFILGVIISFFYADFSSDTIRQKKWYKYRYYLLAAAVVLFSLRRIEQISPFGSTAYYLADYLQFNIFQATGIASFVFIIWMIRTRAVQRVLCHPVLQFIGKISYGIYLMHYILVESIFDNWNRIVPAFPNLTTAFIVMLLACSAATILLATLVHYTIELPFMRMGKRLTKRLKPSLVIN